MVLVRPVTPCIDLSVIWQNVRRSRMLRGTFGLMSMLIWVLKLPVRLRSVDLRLVRCRPGGQTLMSKACNDFIVPCAWLVVWSNRLLALGGLVRRVSVDRSQDIFVRLRIILLRRLVVTCCCLVLEEPMVHRSSLLCRIWLWLRWCVTC